MTDYLVKLRTVEGKIVEVSISAKDDKQALARARKQVGKGTELIVVKLANVKGD